MSDRVNCRNCIHFDDLEHRCCLNDGVLGNERECYFRLSKRTPKGKDVVIEHLKSEIAELKQQLEEKNEQLNKEIKQLKFDCAMYKSANYLINEIGIDKAREIMFQSEKKLKQSQNSKAVEVLERAKVEFETYYADNIWNYPEWIDNQITELRGG